MKDNPFTSDIYISSWLKHFNNSEPGKSFDFLANLLFVKHKFLNLYVNVGKTYTKGISYTMKNVSLENLSNDVFLIYDVHTYYISDKALNRKFKTLRIRQYPGYLIELHNFKSFNDYMISAFNRKSRYKLRSYKKQLEDSFRISYKMYYGDISKKEYDRIFEQFRLLLEKRFNDKRVSNNNLETHEWSFYKDVVYPMILDRKASLNVIFDDDKPIGIMLNYMSENSIYVAITVFDIDYSKFNVGTVNIMNLIEWSMANNYNIVDFSKGYFDYKKRWSSIKYDFEYHILYNANSFYSVLLAYSLQYLFKLKQYLREKRINELIHKFTFYLKNQPQQ